jgi:DNA-binding NarL/FixJ family response regulator
LENNSTRKIRVIVCSEDPFVKISIHHLLAMDWRTQVINVSSEPLTLFDQKSGTNHADILVLDVNSEQQIRSLDQVKQNSSKAIPAKMMVIITNHTRNIDTFLLMDPLIRGVLIKDEINFGLAWALDFAQRGYWVMSPSIQNEMHTRRVPIPNKSMVLRCSPSICGFSPRQIEAIWLGIVMGLDRRIIAREMDITEGTSYGLISAVYRRIGIDELLLGEADLEEYIPEQNTIRSALTSAQSQVLVSGSTHIKDKSELVFHLLTCPEIVEVSV